MPHIPSTHNTARLLALSRLALHMTQNDLATLLGVTRRTIGRWEGSESTPSVEELRQLARSLHPKDSALAAEVAAEGGTTLEALGLVVTAPKAPPPALVAPTPSRPFPPVTLMIDSVVHVAAQELSSHDGRDDPADIVRAVLLSAFGRARGLGLTVEEVEQALSSKDKGKDMGPRDSGKRAGRGARTP